MRIDSLEQLSAAFGQWRSGKRHVREKMPEELLARARRAAKTHGSDRVARATRVDRRRLEAAGSAREGRSEDQVAPTYTRLELAGAAIAAPPFAELETPSGIKVRLFSPTPETLELLSSVCTSEGGR